MRALGDRITGGKSLSFVENKLHTVLMYGCLLIDVGLLVQNQQVDFIDVCVCV